MLLLRAELLLKRDLFTATMVKVGTKVHIGIVIFFVELFQQNVNINFHRKLSYIQYK